MYLISEASQKELHHIAKQPLLTAFALIWMELVSFKECFMQLLRDYLVKLLYCLK